MGKSGRDRVPGSPIEQIAAVLDGASAIAITEACAAEAAGVASTGLAGDEGVSAFEHRVKGHRANLLGRAVSGVDASDSRGALATTLGLAMSGLRATAFVGAGDLQSAHDQLLLAAGRHAPLVVHLGCRATGGPGIAIGSGHDAYHAAAGAGLVQLFATNVQEAVDFSLVARRVAEQALVPVLVAVDWEQTARSVQDVSLPSAELVRAYLGRPSDEIDVPTPAQALLFGGTRRRVPRWYDLERPMMQGAVLGTESFGVAAAARRPFFDDHVPAALAEAFDAFSRVAGRSYSGLREHALERAEVVVVVQGAAVETTIAVADYVRNHDKLRVGVVGVGCLRPLPAARLAELCAGARRVVVMERTGASLAADPPLMRELLAAAHRAPQPKRNRPAFVSAVYGVGGLPLRAGDVRAAILGGDESPVYIGVEFAPGPSDLPKRQALLDQLRRDYPDLARLQRIAEEPVDMVQPGGFLAGVFRTEGGAGGRAARIVASTVGQAAGGHVRGRSGTGWERWGRHACDRVMFASDAVPSMGDEAPVDVALVCTPLASLIGAAAGALRADGAIVLDTATSSEQIVAALTPGALARVRDSRASVYRSAGKRDENDENDESAALREERLGGALLGALVAQGLVDVSRRKLVTARNQSLSELSPSEREAHVNAFGAGFDTVEPIALTGEAGARPTTSSPPVAVAQLRARHERDENVADSLPRFWNQVGVLYEEPGQISPTLSADPYLAVGVVPPLSAALRGVRDGADILPRFDAGKCTGCAQCWLQCPDGAIAPAAYRPAALLEAGVALAKSSGAGADALRPMIPKIAPLVTAHLGAHSDAPTAASALFDQACGGALAAAPLPDERKQALLGGFERTLAALGDLPLARTETLFDDLERAAAGKGALLTLAIDPNVCKGCGACVAACADDALIAEERTAERADAAQEAWALWQRLPDTASDTISAAREHEKLGDLAALMLSRHCSFATAGADGAEPGSGAKLALRLVMAAAEFQLQRRLQVQVERVETYRADLAKRVHEALSKGLPTGDLDALAGKLDAASRSSANLAELSTSAEGVDVAGAKQLVHAARALDDLHERLTVGPFGLGRSRLGLVVAPDPLTEGISAFPYNPFQVPTIVDISGEAAALARGALEGQIRAVAEELAILRRAELELSSPTRAALADAELAQLAWSDLTPQERELCPPLVLIGGSASFTDRALSRLLDGDLPVVVVLLSGGAGDGDEAHWSGRTALGALAFGLSNPNVFVLQSSLAFPQHLGAGLMRAFAHRGPALIHLHAPSPTQHGFSTDAAVAQARLAVTSRAFPLVVFDPAAEGVFGTHVSLDGNPEPTEPWCRDEHGAAITPATWAATESRFASWFGPAAGVPKPTAMDSYLALDARARGAATPVIAEGAERRAVMPVGVSVCERRRREWRVLCELAGLVTPFTERVQEEAKTSVAAAHANELAQESGRHAEEVRALRAQYRAEAAEQIRERLLSLAGYSTNGLGRESQ